VSERVVGREHTLLPHAQDHREVLSWREGAVEVGRRGRLACEHRRRGSLWR